MDIKGGAGEAADVRVRYKRARSGWGRTCIVAVYAWVWM